MCARPYYKDIAVLPRVSVIRPVLQPVLRLVLQPVLQAVIQAQQAQTWNQHERKIQRTGAAWRVLHSTHPPAGMTNPEKRPDSLLNNRFNKLSKNY